MSVASNSPPIIENPHSQCCSDTPGDGCGVDFPDKTSPGLCQKCTLLDSLEPTSDQYQHATRFPQCMTCGVAWKRLPFTDQCGKCHEKSLVAAGAVNHGLNVAVNARRDAFAVRTHRPPKTNALAGSSAQPTIELNTAALDQFRNVGYNEADCVKVYAEPRIVNKIVHRLGSTSRSYPPQTMVSEIKSDLVNAWNITWLKDHLIPLSLQRTELRFHGNQNPLPDSEHLAVLDFYQAHKSAGNHDAYFTKLPKHAATQKGKVLAIELYMDDSEAAAISGSKSISSVKKRKSKSTGEAEEASVKRPRVTPVGSNFVRQLPGPDPTQSTNINLVFANLTVNPETCEVSTDWPVDNSTATAALIADEVFHSGKMKHCFKLQMAEGQFVAKRFYEVGQGRDEVTLTENETNLRSEIYRAEQARWFLKNFREEEDSVNLMGATNFEITECRLAFEVVESEGKPSPASGVASEVLESTPNGRVVWMVEPLRNPTVTHYSGTMDHPIGTGQLAHTLTAFVHYAFEHSHGDLLFADVQGSFGRLSNKTMGIIIFDLMTHTVEGESGVGDHGPEGIQKWRDQHDCNVFCKRLELETGESDSESY